MEYKTEIFPPGENHSLSLTFQDFIAKYVNSKRKDKIVINLENQENAVPNLWEHEEILNLKLEELNMSFCSLFEVPIVIFNFKYLSDLDLSNNFLNSLPTEIKNLQNLTTLVLSSNNLYFLPKSIANVHRLMYLNLSYNKFTDVPDVLFTGLGALKILDLSYNKITNFNSAPLCVKNIIELRICNNILENLPKWLFNNLCQLEVLDVSENTNMLLTRPILTYYNSRIFETLRILNIENCNYNYRRILFLSYFKNLELLQMGNGNKLRKGKNYLGYLNMEVFKNLLYLRSLCMQNIEISVLPLSFDSLKRIEFLDLSLNMLSWLPESFCNLVCLKFLYLSSNQLLFLPNDIYKLENLQQIHLEKNHLYQLPENFSKLKCLEYVDVYNNEIEKIDPLIFEMKNLKGIDLGFNHIDFNMLKCDPVDGLILDKYISLKNNFRKNFIFMEDRSDLQLLKSSGDSVDEEINNAGILYSIKCHEKEVLSDYVETDSCMADEDSVHINYLDYDELDEDWNKVRTSESEQDDFFDPNILKYKSTPPNRSISFSNFQNNFCPANEHVQPLMKNYKRNFRLALEKSIVEGQFDSD